MARPITNRKFQLDPRDRGIDLGKWLGINSGEGMMGGDRVPLGADLPPGIAEQFVIPIEIPGFIRSVFEEGATRIPLGEAPELPWPYNTNWVWVLSGGGEKGAFQLGVAQYLIGKGGSPLPRGIAGTSVGSVNALALAESYYTGVEKLRDIWLGLSHRSEMYAWAPWVESVNNVLRPHGLDIRKLLSMIPIAGLSGEMSLPSVDRLLNLEGFGEFLYNFFSDTPGPISFVVNALLAGVPALLLLVSISSGAEELQNAISRAMRIMQDESDGLFTLDPLRRLMNNFLDVHRLLMPIRFVTVGASDGRVYHALSDINRPEGSRIIMAEEDPEGGLDYTELGTLAIAELGQRLIQAALASAAIPFVNPPIDWPINLVLKGQTYKTDTKAFIDGGVREVIPVEAGLAMLDNELAHLSDPRGIIAISVNQPFVDPDDLVSIVKPELNPLPPVERNAAADFNIFDMASLGFNHATDEVVNNELRSAVEDIPDDVDHILIAPSISMSSHNKLDPGMTQLLLAYGYMTAFDQMTRRLLNLDYDQYRERLWRSTNEIMQARYLCWHIERGGESFRLGGPGWNLIFEIYRGFSGPQWSDSIINFSDFDERVLSRDFDWVIADDRLDRQPRDKRPSVRELKRHVQDWVNIRVRDWGLESIPDIHDLSSFGVGNENHPIDWWRRFERHGFAEADFGGYFGGYPTGPGTVVVPGGWLPIYPFRRIGPGSLVDDVMPGHRTETSPWNAAIVFITGTETSRDAPFLRFVPEETLPLSPFERNPDYGVVRLEGYVLANNFELPFGTEAVELFSIWGIDFTDHWTSSSIRGRYPDTPGYANRVSEGRIFNPERLKPLDTIPLVSWYSPSRNDHLTTSDFRFTFDPWGNARRLIPPDYQFQRVVGYLYSPYIPLSELRRRFGGTVLPLWSWYSPSRKDFFTTADPNWRPNFVNLSEEITARRPRVG